MIFTMMMYMYSLMLIIFLLIILINKLNFKKKTMNMMMTIECGFNNFNNKHIPLMNNFFMIFMIFMIFDLEFFLIIPLINLIKNFNWMMFLFMFLIINLFIYISMMYEIKYNFLNWIK